MNGSNSRALAGALFAACAACSIRDSRAQLLDQFSNPNIRGFDQAPGVTVASRREDEYDAPGVRVGSFLLRPELGAYGGYDDNVLGTKQRAGSSLLETRATLDARSDWARDSVSFDAVVDNTEYFDQPKQSETNWSAAIAGAYDIGRDTASVNYMHENANQSPRDLDTPLLDKVIAYRIDDVRLSYATAFDALSVRPELGVSYYSFDNGTIAGAPYLQDFRDRVVVTPGVVAGYDLAPQRTLVGVVRTAVADYNRQDAGGRFHSYVDTTVLAGIDYGYDGPWRYRALAGFEVRTFSNAAFKTISAPVAELTLIYNASGITTVTGTVQRRIEDSADETTTGYTETALKLTVDHEYLRNVRLQARGRAYIDSYGQGGGTQVLYTAGAGATWLLDRNIRLSATYDATVRGSASAPVNTTLAQPGPGQGFFEGYNENRYLLHLVLRL